MRELNQHFADDIKTYIEVNEILQVITGEADHNVTYHSRINDISEGKLIIAWPTHAGMRMLAHRDQILIFHFMRDGVPHEFTGMVDATNPTGLPELTLILSSAVSRIQRRQNFRIKCMLPIEIVGVLKNPQDDSTVSVNIRTTTSDLSASGLAVRSPKPIPENSNIEVKLGLPDDGPVIRIPCRIVYCDVPGEHQSLYRMGFQFLAISESERARIVRHVYRSQLKGLHP